jgi:hypothetical protein
MEFGAAGEWRSYGERPPTLGWRGRSSIRATGMTRWVISTARPIVLP